MIFRGELLFYRVEQFEISKYDDWWTGILRYTEQRLKLDSWILDKYCLVFLVEPAQFDTPKTLFHETQSLMSYTYVTYKKRQYPVAVNLL